MEQNREFSRKPEFKPINEGLGFHPFSDGMPYTPSPLAKHKKAPVISSSVEADAESDEFLKSLDAQALFPSEPKEIKSEYSIPDFKDPGQLIFSDFQMTTSANSNARTIAKVLVRPQTVLKNVETTPAKMKTESSKFLTALAYLFDATALMGVSVLGLWLVSAQIGLESQVLWGKETFTVTLGFILMMTFMLILIQRIVFKTTLFSRVLGLDVK